MAGPNAGKSSRERAGRGQVRFAPLAVTFILTFCFWILFSGKLDLFHLAAGILSCAMVSLLTHRLIFPGRISAGFIGNGLRLLGYTPWLIYKIMQANLHLLYLTFHPRMMEKIDPKVIRFDTRLASDFSRTIFANSITLTPGTITVYAGVMGRFAVHCIDPHSGQDLPGKMEDKIAGVFNE